LIKVILQSLDSSNILHLELRSRVCCCKRNITHEMHHRTYNKAFMRIGFFHVQSALWIKIGDCHRDYDLDLEVHYIKLNWIAANRCEFCLNRPLRDLKIAMILMYMHVSKSKYKISWFAWI